MFNKPEDFYMQPVGDIQGCIDQMAKANSVVSYWNRLDKIDRAQMILSEPEIVDHILLAFDIKAAVDNFLEELEEHTDV